MLLQGGTSFHKRISSSFLYSTNGKQIQHHDIRHSLSRSREIYGFHTPAALLEKLSYDFEERITKFFDVPDNKKILQEIKRYADEHEERYGSLPKTLIFAVFGRGDSFVQMMGRGTRKGELYPDKLHFVVFDCFGGTLIDYFEKATDMTTEPPKKEVKPIKNVVEDIWNNRDRAYNVRVLAKRLNRID